MDTTKTAYFVTPRPGTYGDRATVLSSHRTLAAAVAAAKRIGGTVRVGDKVRGDIWFRVYGETYPQVAS